MVKGKIYINSCITVDRVEDGFLITFRNLYHPLLCVHNGPALVTVDSFITSLCAVNGHGLMFSSHLLLVVSETS